MKRIITSVISAALLAAVLPAQAGEYVGYVRNWWIEENGDVNFYFLNETNTTTVTGLCGWNLYRLEAGKTHYDETYSSLLLAAKNSYRVRMEVTSCSAQINIIKKAKVCTWTGDC